MQRSGGLQASTPRRASPSRTMACTPDRQRNQHRDTGCATQLAFARPGDDLRRAIIPATEDTMHKFLPFIALAAGLCSVACQREQPQPAVVPPTNTPPVTAPDT